MNSYGLSAGSSGGVSIDFSGQSSGPVPVQNIRVICRCYCGRNFLRSPLSIEKECSVCIREAADREKEMQAIPPADGPGELKRGVKKGKTTVDPRERMSAVYRKAAEALDMKPGAVQ